MGIYELRLRGSLIVGVPFELGSVSIDKENKGAQSPKNSELRSDAMKAIF